MQVQPEIIVAILSLFGLGLIGIIQTLKRIFKLEDRGALALTFVVSFASTAFYLAYIQAFSLLSFIIYGLIVFGEASGLYHVIKKA